MSMAYELNSPDVMAEDFDADLVLLNLRSGEYFNITGGARAFLDQVLAGVSPSNLSGMLEAAKAEAGAAATDFFDNMQKHNLVRAIPDSDATAADATHVQAIITAGADFPFECYDDLSDLLAADPIHDVSPEAGWPVMPDQT